MNTIALCIPAYNAAWCLPRLLKSALNQAIPFDEILVYNDCSTDNTTEIALSFGAKVLSGIVNKGCSFGKNELAKVSKSEWLHFHDADDELLPNFTTLSHKWINKQECPDVILFDYEYRDNYTHNRLGLRKFDRHSLEKDAVKYSIMEQINPFCGLYNKRAFLAAGGYDTDSKVLYNEDCAMHISLAINGLSFSCESEISIINYYIKNSMSQNNAQKCAIARYHVLKKISASHGNQYAKEISDQIWTCISSLSVFQEWGYIKKALAISECLGYPSSDTGSKLFNSLTKINPFFAVWLREKLIRLFKPHIRNHG